jgi:RNA polymerase sigma-70 factor (ECF subfamily)
MTTEPAQAPPGEIERIFRDHHGMVYRAAYRITGNPSDAEDVLQTVFLRLVRRDASAEAVENMPSYLHRAAVNSALDLMRARQNARNIPLDDVAPSLKENSALAPDRAHASAESREWLRAAVARLSPQAAEIFSLRFFEGKDNSEIAEIVGTTVGTVAVTLSRVRDRIEKEYRAYQGEKS